VIFVGCCKGGGAVGPYLVGAEAQNVFFGRSYERSQQEPQLSFPSFWNAVIYTVGVLMPHFVRNKKICRFQMLYMFINSVSTRFLSAIELSVVANSPPLHSEFLLIDLLALQVPRAQCRVPSIHVKVCRGFEAAK
jgi:hypothetical protein